MAGRDYSLTGESARKAIAIGLAGADWYHSDVPRATMKDLMQRSDGPATRDTLIWLGCLVFGGLGGVFLGLLVCVPFFLVYGVLYGSAGDSAGTNAGTARPSRRSGRTTPSIRSPAS